MKCKSMTALLLAGTMLFSMTGCSTTNNQQAGTASAETTEAAKTVEKEGEKETTKAEASEAAAGFGEKDPASYQADLKFMVHSTGQPEYMIQKFNEKYPNIKIELVVIPAGEQQEKIMSMVAAGDDVPDLFTCRTQFVKAIVNSDQYYADLLSEPFNAGEWTSQIEPYVVSVGTQASTGALRALSWQCPVGGIFYRRSMAKEIFGSDDPEEMAKQFSSFEALLEATRKVKEKTNGEVAFTADALTDLMYLGVTNAGGYIKDDKLNTGEEIRQLFEYAKIMYDEDLTAKYYKDDTAGVAATAEGKIFCTAKPTWGLNYNIMPNYPDQAGDWALTSGPYPYTAGGTWLGIYKDTKYPEECYLFLKFILTDPEFVRSYALDFGDYVSNVEIQKEVGAFTKEEGEGLNIFAYLDGQNAYSYWNGELAKGIDAESFTPYDEFFGNYLLAAMQSYAVGNSDLEKAIEQYKNDCQSYAPSLAVE